MNISDSNAEIHGITNEMVKDAPIFKQAAKEIAEFIGESDMADTIQTNLTFQYWRKSFYV